jgi:hypothetical protein
MDQKRRSWSDPQSDYPGISDESEKLRQESDKPFQEFEYQMREMERLDAEFKEKMKIPEVEEFERMMKKYDRLINDPDNARKHIAMLVESSGISLLAFYKYIHDRIRKSKVELSDY